MTPLEQAFERFYLRDRDPNSPITRDALVRGADGQYFHQHTRTYLAYFEAGFDHGMATSAEAIIESAEPEQAPEQPSPVAEPDEIFPFYPSPPNDGHKCDGEGPRTAWGTTTCSKCGFDWELPF